MNTRTIWVLLACVLVLGAVAAWQLKRERQGDFDVDRALLPGIVPQRIRSFRIDSLERGFEMRVVLDDERGWQLVDPVEYPAEPGRLRQLLSIATSNRATVEERTDLENLQLAPPRVVLEITEERPSGEYVHRLELGGLALDRGSVYARVGGEVVLTSANIDTLLEHEPNVWRRQTISSISPQAVEEIHRSGRIRLPGSDEEFELAFSASMEGPGLWRSSRPFRATLDLVAFGGMLGRSCTLRAAAFLQDSVTDPSVYGMDEPEIRLELITNRGEREVLLLRQQQKSEFWLCMVEGGSHLYTVGLEDALIVATPAEAMIDMELVHMVRDSIDVVRLVSGGGEVQLERQRSGWTVSATRGGSQSVEPAPADPERVADLLGELERARFLRMDLGLEFRTGIVPEGLYIEADGVTFGGAFGIPQTLEGGVEALQMLRAGDEVVGLVEPALAELARTPYTALLDRRLLKLSELAILRLELAGAGSGREYVRNTKSGLWSPRGVEREATEILPWIDKLLSLTAEEVLDPRASYDPIEPVQVTIVDGGGVEYVYTIARAGPAGERPDATLYQGTERLAVLADEPEDGFHASLWRLLTDAE